nr:hypothetical protein [Desulfobulbaceae bacterium]
MKTLGRHITTALLIASLSLLTCKASSVKAADLTEQPQYSIAEIIYSQGETDSPVLTIKGDSEQPPTFISYDLFDPLRVVIDIAAGSFGEGVTLPIEINSGAVASVQGKVLAEQQPAIAKIEVLLTQDNQYVIEKVNNDIQIRFAEIPPMASASDVPSTDPKPEATPTVLEIGQITVRPENNGVKITLVAGQPITDYERVVLAEGSGRPDRMYLDIHGATAPSLPSITAVNVGALARLRTSTKENGVRIVFDSSINQLFDYDIDTTPEGLQVTIKTPDNSDGDPGSDPISTLLSGLNNHEDLRQQEPAAETYDNQVTKQLKRVGVSGDSFVDAGYDQERITVDFYKTNIENVFYLLKEISGRNFVVDDSVSGNVTLYLEKVPWDFILDVVLNLKGLQKAEKFNTIVISPQSKNFTWPEDTASTEVTFEAPDQDLVAQINEQLSQPAEVVEAKMHIKKASELAQKQQLTAALDSYKKAFMLWPDNISLIKRIARFCLAEMGNYICAEDYGRKALALDESDSEAIVQMALTLANMDNTEAEIFFEKATQGERPDPDALLNFAAYYENKGANEQALELLTRYESIYERTLATMIAKARIYDKENQPDKAEEIFETIILYTGFELPPDLEKFIKGRLALRDTQHR